MDGNQADPATSPDYIDEVSTDEQLRRAVQTLLDKGHTDQQKVAEAMEISDSTLSRWLAGENKKHLRLNSLDGFLKFRLALRKATDQKIVTVEAEGPYHEATLPGKPVPTPGDSTDASLVPSSSRRASASEFTPAENAELIYDLSRVVLLASKLMEELERRTPRERASENRDTQSKSRRRHRKTRSSYS